MTARCGLRRAMLAGLALAGACHEIPPEIPPGYIGSPAPKGWPPLTVYRLEPLHPRNRWFHRAFSARAPGGEILPAHADEPFGRLESSSPVDRAEIAAILESVAAEDAGSSPTGRRAAIGDAMFHSDLLAEAARWHAIGLADASAREVIASMLRVARSARVDLLLKDLHLPELAPPPLRGGEWRDAELPALPGLLPSAQDPRWTRLLRARGPQDRALLIRFRAGLDGAGRPALLDLASECWEIELARDGAGGGAAKRVWRFDRAEWLHGREPWHEAPARAEIGIRDPRDPAKLLSGPVERVCGSCHCGTAGSSGAPESSATANGAGKPQEEMVRAALAVVLEAGRPTGER